MADREIKFRAYNKSTKLMIEIFNSSIQKEWYLPNWKEKYEVMQFSGETDYYGLEIYEGDICKLNDEFDGKVHFKNGCFMLLGHPLAYSLINAKVKVIGNIYENSELLK